MLSAVLNSETTVKASVKTMNAFVEMRHFIADSAHMFEQIRSIDHRLGSLERSTDERFERVFDRLLIINPRLGGIKNRIEQLVQVARVDTVVLGCTNRRVTSCLVDLQAVHRSDIVCHRITAIEPHFNPNHSQVLSYVRNETSQNLVQETLVHVGVLVSICEGVIEVVSTTNVLSTQFLKNKIDFCTLFLGYGTETGEGNPWLSRYLSNVFSSVETLRGMAVDTIVKIRFLSVSASMR